MTFRVAKALVAVAVALVCWTLGPSPLRAQESATPGEQNVSAVQPGPRDQGEVLAGQVTLGVGGLFLAGGMGLVIAGAAQPPCGGWAIICSKGIFDFFGAVALGAGLVAAIIGGILWADGSRPATARTRVALTGGPGDVGLGLDVLL